MEQDKEIDSQVRLVGKKSIWPWLLLLLGILLVGALLYKAMDKDNNENVNTTVRNTNTQSVLPTPENVNLNTNTSTNGGAGAVITNLADLSIGDLGSLQNRQFDLAGVAVKRVVGDKVFYVNTNNNQEMLVYLDPQLDNGGAEQKVVVKAGQNVAMKGSVQALPAFEQLRQWGLTDADVQGLQGQQVYLRASQISVAQ